MAVIRNNNKLSGKWKSKDEETMLNTSEKAAYSLFVLRNQGDHGTEEEPIVWDDLDEDAKMELINQYWMRVLKDLGAEATRAGYANTAKEDAQEDIDDNIGIESDD